MTFSPCWFWEKGIEESVLKVLEEEIKTLELLPSMLSQGRNDTDVRNSSSNALPSHHWFTGIMTNFAIHANREAGWKRTLEFPEVTQIAEYKPDQYYKWHADINPFSVAEYERKVSVVCLITDPSEFEGGELELEHVSAPKLKRGSVIAFPSILRHQVTPVTKGKRVTATCWVIGPQKW